MMTRSPSAAASSGAKWKADRRVGQPAPGGVGQLDSAAAYAPYRIRHEALAVGDVPDVHLLVLAQVGRVEQVLVDGDRPDVVEVGLGHGGPVDLGLHHGAQHLSQPFLT